MTEDMSFIVRTQNPQDCSRIKMTMYFYQYGDPGARAISDPISMVQRGPILCM